MYATQVITFFLLMNFLRLCGFLAVYVIFPSSTPQTKKQKFHKKCTLVKEKLEIFKEECAISNYFSFFLYKKKLHSFVG